VRCTQGPTDVLLLDDRAAVIAYGLGVASRQRSTLFSVMSQGSWDNEEVI
jgi:hypothetical protein